MTTLIDFLSNQKEKSDKKRKRSKFGNKHHKKITTSRRERVREIQKEHFVRAHSSFGTCTRTTFNRYHYVSCIAR